MQLEVFGIALRSLLIIKYVMIQPLYQWNAFGGSKEIFRYDIADLVIRDVLNIIGSSCTASCAKASVERQSILSTVFHVHESVIRASRCAAACIGVAAFRTLPCRDIVPVVYGDLGDYAF